MLLGNVIKDFHGSVELLGNNIPSFHGGPVLLKNFIASGQIYWNGGLQVLLAADGGAALLGNVSRDFHGGAVFFGNGIAGLHGGPVLLGNFIASGQTHWNGGL